MSAGSLMESYRRSLVHDQGARTNIRPPTRRRRRKNQLPLLFCSYPLVIINHARKSFKVTSQARLLVFMVASVLLIACPRETTIAATTNTIISNTFTPLLQDQNLKPAIIQQHYYYQANTNPHRLLHRDLQLSPTSVSPQPLERDSVTSAVWRGLSTSTPLGRTPSTGSSAFPAVTVARSDMLASSGATSLSQKQQQTSTTNTTINLTKSLKFTLIAGRYWKFQIKTNSFQSSHKEKELRLHRNVSTNNFIIDDDGWFQYDPQKQLLFAWPSLRVESKAYYFVLLPSGLDYEADGENIINSADVVANIVVELLPPLYVGTNSADIEQYIDHKFSLDYLHRHQTFPLLLSEVISIFETLSKDTNISTSVESTSVARISHTTTPAVTLQQAASTNSIQAAIKLNKHTKSLNKLNEFLLIDLSATSDGELFSISWTTHHSLINNTVTYIEECRIGTINDTVTKLSSRSLSFPPVNDKFVISYSLEGPLINTNTIIPTERGNYALSLTLNEPCRKRHIFEILGLTSVSDLFVKLPIDSEEGNPLDSNIEKPKDLPKQNSKFFARESAIPRNGSDNIPVKPTPLSPTITSERDDEESHEQSLNFTPKTSSRPSTVFETAADDKLVQSITSDKSSNTHLEGTLRSDLRSISSGESVQGSSPVVTQNPISPAETNTAVHAVNPGTTFPPEPISEATNVSTATSLETDRTHLTIPTELSKTPVSSISNAPGSTLGINLSEQTSPPPRLLKAQPSAKSFADFVDSQPSVGSIVDQTTMSEPPSVATAGGQSTDTLTTYNETNATYIPSPVQTTTMIPTANLESSLNEDLIGILNEVTAYLVSVAIPVTIIIGSLLIVSIIIALCNLCMKRRKSKQFEVGDRFKFRYGSERRQFLKNRSKPVILEADRKSLSMGGTPQHRPFMTPNDAKPMEYQKMTPVKTNAEYLNDRQVTTSFGAGSDRVQH